MKNTFFTISTISENITKLFLETIKYDLEKLHITDLNHVLCLLLYNIGEQKLVITDLIKKGCYKGTNVSYNLKNLIKHNYVETSNSPFDKRIIYVQLSEHGKKIYTTFNEILENKNKHFLREFEEVAPPTMIYNLFHKMETFLDNSIRYS